MPEAAVMRGIQQAFLAGVVAQRDFPRATAMSASAMQVATICGPAAGGLLYAAGGPGAAYASAAAGVLVSAVMVLFIRTTQRVAIAVRKAFDAPGVMIAQLNGKGADKYIKMVNDAHAAYEKDHGGK